MSGSDSQNESTKLATEGMPSINLDQLDWLFSDECRSLMHSHAGADPARLALQLQSQLGPKAAWLATQLHLRQKHAHRLPHLLSHPDTRLLPVPAEQSSSEAAAHLRWHNLSTHFQHATDLTAGLGTDCRIMAIHSAQVTAVEADPLRAELLRRNHQLLGIPNIEVVEATAEAYLAAASPTDFVFLDPDRRPGGSPRAVALADIQPDLRLLLPRLRQLAPQVQVKLSPLFDIDSAFAQLPDIAEAWALSVDGEVKEVGLGWRETGGAAATIGALGQKGERRMDVRVPWAQWKRPIATPAAGQPQSFVLIPDAALVKARLVAHLERLLPPGSVCTGPLGLWLCSSPPEPYLGRVFQVQHRMPYQPRAVKAWLAAEGIAEANIAVREAPLSTADVRRTLGVREGGQGLLLVTPLPHQSRSGYWLLQLAPLP